MTLKVSRRVADPASFQVVGHAGPQRLIPSGTAGNTFAGDLLDGGTAGFAPEPDVALNVRAVFVPDNIFSLGRPRHNKKKGTATLAVNVPNPGELTLSGKGIRAGAAKSIPAAGEAELLIKARGKAMRKLRKSGKVKQPGCVCPTPSTP